MSQEVLRKDKTCLNCKHVVDQRFCPNCGQENTESRKTFHHLFIHFFEDLTHYENAFWRTIKNLLLNPSALTSEYLSGKRLSYLAPIRLYIFISFITFFLFAVIPDSEVDLQKAKQTVTTPVKDENSVRKNSVIVTTKGFKEILEKQNETTQRDSVKYADLGSNRNAQELFNSRYKSVEALDSLQKFGPKSERLSNLEYWVCKKTLYVVKNNTTEEILEKFKESFLHNIPKVLFIYMPIFAFFLWLFHSKKRWYYFEHGIFTIHYFSFLLLMVLLLFLIDVLLSYFGESSVASMLNNTIHYIALCWMVYYFFPAHQRFYKETRMVSFVKSAALLIINSILIMLMLALFALYTFINLH